MITSSTRARKNARIILGHITALWKEGEISLFEYQSYQALFKEGLEENDMSCFRTEITNRMAFLPNQSHFKIIIEHL